MRSAVLVVPGHLEQRTGGYIYNRRMVEELRRCGWRVDVIELDDGFPTPAPHALAHAARALARLPDGTVTIVDSLALGAMPDQVAAESRRLRIVALVHLPLAAAVGLEPRTAARRAVGERRALLESALVVVTGHAALPLLAPYGLPADRVVVIEPGTDVPERAVGPALGPSVGSAAGSPVESVASGFGRTSTVDKRRATSVELLCVATVNAIKGHEMLLESLAAMRSTTWRLTCAGSLTRDPVTADRVRAAVEWLGLDDRVSLVGDLDEAALADCFSRADVFVLATRQETYGMAVAEALAHGLPVVATATGAIADLVGDEAGIVVPVGDRAALTAALARVVDDAALRARFAEGARRARHRLPTWDAAIARMSGALEALTHG